MWLDSTKTKVTINREEGRENKCKHGLRQGDPLAPLLFMITPNGLNTIKKKAKGKIKKT